MVTPVSIFADFFWIGSGLQHIHVLTNQATNFIIYEGEIFGATFSFIYDWILNFGEGLYTFSLLLREK